ncbi:hypothetical protein BHE74_00003408 [Ensete ventricosum]|nr:hypothetical protein GW17_00003092 [Ensete ventricosum]RWW87745.1 hypothetical protein BHE74_00003408 [Ensete ventricosum]RZR83495.1 hypothetical protein BHM03_00010105 [Ensete ventricosum]
MVMRFPLAKRNPTEAMERRNPSNVGFRHLCRPRRCFIRWAMAASPILGRHRKQRLQRCNTADAHNPVSSLFLSCYRPPPTYRRTLTSTTWDAKGYYCNFSCGTHVKRVYHIRRYVGRHTVVSTLR